MSNSLSRLPAPLARNSRVQALARSKDQASRRASALRGQLERHAPARVMTASTAGAFGAGFLAPQLASAMPVLGPAGATVALGALLAGLGAWTQSPDLVAAGSGALSGAAYVAGLNMSAGNSPLSGLAVDTSAELTRQEPE